VSALRLWLVRHGETAWNAEHRLQGSTDLGLTEVGVAQAGNVRAAIAGSVFAGVWSSDLRRALETARLAYGEPVVDARLREIDFGALEGLCWADLEPSIQADLVEFETFQAPGGESAEVFEERVLDFVGALAPGDHLIFTHGGVVRTLGRRCGVGRYPHHGELIVLEWNQRAEITQR
jgi:probable phosphoglycerate mutase